MSYLLVGLMKMWEYVFWPYNPIGWDRATTRSRKLRRPSCKRGTIFDRPCAHYCTLYAHSTPIDRPHAYRTHTTHATTDNDYVVPHLKDGVLHEVGKKRLDLLAPSNLEEEAIEDHVVGKDRCRIWCKERGVHLAQGISVHCLAFPSLRQHNVRWQRHGCGLLLRPAAQTVKYTRCVTYRKRGIDGSRDEQGNDNGGSYILRSTASFVSRYHILCTPKY